MKKRLVAFLLVLIMVLGMLPVSAFAADDGVSPQALESNETQTIKYQILYVGDEFNIGYNYGVSVNKTYTCQYSTGHSGFNHSILISEFRNVGVPALKGQLDSGYEFVGWAKEAKKNPTIFDFNTAGTTATQTTYTIYLVAKKTNPTPTYMYYLYYKYNDGTDSTWLTDVTDRPTAATTFTFNVNRAKLTRSGYDHIGWADKADAVTAKYTGGDPIVLTKDNPTKTIYAVWMPFFELKYDANGGTGAPASQTRTAAHPTVNRVTFTVPNQTPSKEGYTFKGWADSAAATTAQYQPGDTVDVKHENSPKTVYAVWQSNTPPTDKPAKPTENDVTGVVVDIVCVTTTGTHDTVQYPLGHPTDAQHTIGEVVSDGAGGYICPVTVRTAWFVQQASNLRWRVQHTPTAQTITFNLTYDKTNKKWVKPAANPRIEATHEVTPPTKPTALDGSFAIVCKNNKATHPYKADYIATPSQYTISDVQMDDQGYYVTATVTVAPNLVAYNKATRVEHRLVDEQDATLTITFRYDTEATVDGNRKWQQQGDLPVVEVICKEIEAPTREDIFGALNGLVTVTCINRFWKDGNNNMDCGQGQYAAKAGIVGQEYTLVKGEDAGTWVVTFPVTNFVKSFKQDPAHNLYTKDTLSWYIRWKDNAWTSAPVEPGVDDLVKLTHAPTDWREVAKIATGGKSDCIHTLCKNSGLNHVWEAEPVEAGKDDVCTIAHNWVVTFNPDNGEPAFTQNVEYEGKAIKPTPDPEKTGYTFDGWYLDEAEAPFSFDTTITSDITLKAKWTQNTYTVTFDANGGEGTMDDQTFTYDEEKALTTNAFTRTGYTFTGWNTAADGTGEAFADKATVKNLTAEPNGAVTLYAQWEAKNDTPYKVKYYIEKLDGTYDYNDSYEGRGTTDTRIDATKVHNKSYENFTLDLNHPDTVQFGNIAGDGSLVLKLFYTRNTYDYTVRHIKQLPDGSYDEANAEVETLSGKFEALAAVTAKDYGEHYPTNDADTKQNIKIEEGLTIDVKYDLDEHTLTFETNGGSAINPVTVRHGNAVARPADPTKDKYTFIGWYADPEFTEEYDFATVLEADKTIYAKFELTSTPIGDIYVRYDVLHIKQLPDGTYDLANAEVEHLSAKKDSTVTAVIKDYRATHHVNVNRTLSKLTGTAIQPYKGVDGKPVYTILSVYYDLDFHTLTFDTMGGSKIAPETVRHGLTVAKPKDPVNGGYWFDGWYTDKTFRHRYDFSTPLTEDITIYAKWFLIVLPGVTVKKNTPKLNTADHFAYVQGYPDGTVKPAGNITRAETAAILFRLMDDASRKTYYSTKSGFRDVASGSWYNTYVATLNNAGVITDSSNGYFRPNEAITRAELAAMLAKFSETTGAANYFNDVSAKYWAANAIAICAKLGWITGYPDGTFRPDKNVTRAELMAMINRATGRAPKSADAFLPGMKTWIDNTSDKWYYLDVQEATNSHSYTVKGSETWTALTSDPNWSLYE